MKISKETIAVLKAMSAINSNILLKAGNVITTISPQKNVLATVEVTETFDTEFGVYDLGELLGVFSIFADPDIEFNTQFVTITEGESSIKYYAADPSILVVPTKPIKMPETDVQFELPAATLAMALKTAGVLRSSDITLKGNGKNISIVVADLKSDTSNSFNVVVGKSDVKFTAHLKVDNIKLVAGDYLVELSSKKISRFSAKVGSSVTYIALESGSTFA
jgi:hypothetical protein